jgi:hypothetical protein
LAEDFIEVWSECSIKALMLAELGGKGKRISRDGLGDGVTRRCGERKKESGLAIIHRTLCRLLSKSPQIFSFAACRNSAGDNIFSQKIGGNFGFTNRRRRLKIILRIRIRRGLSHAY